MSRKNRTEAVAYLRTSSAANVGGDRDSEPRQRAAIDAFAKRSGMAIVETFRDPAVSGADPIEDRPGFKALLERIAGNGVRTVIVEDASRFARELMVQELGILMLIKREVRVLTAAGDDLTATNDPARTMVRQVLGSFAEYEKARLVEKLRGARERAKAAGGKKGGQWSHASRNPELVQAAKRLHRASPKTGKRRSLRVIAAELAALGFVNSAGRPFNPNSVRSILAQEVRDAAGAGE